MKKQSTSRIFYEWSIETSDDFGDIVNNEFFDKLPTQALEPNQQLCLVRDEVDEADGVTDRFWAYVKEGKLPEYFEDGAGVTIGIRVPKKYHNELK